PVAQDVLLDFAGRGLGQPTELEALGDLVPGQPLPCVLGQRVRVASSFLSMTKATGTSPQRSCGRPTTALSTTEGWLSSTCSTSTEAMFSPPEMMMSLLRSRIST